VWILTFYRFYISIGIGVVAACLFVRTWWFGLMTAVGSRIFWGVVEYFVHQLIVDRLFARHAHEFKQQLGPYGIRLVNRAEHDRTVKTSLTEVFTNDEKKLRKAVENLEMMDTLFRAGMRPDGDTYQLHDLKLKYGKYRIENLDKNRSGNISAKV
jgi:hypothetical protein